MRTTLAIASVLGLTLLFGSVAPADAGGPGALRSHRGHFGGHGLHGHGFHGHGFKGHAFHGHGFHGHGFKGHGFHGHGFRHDHTFSGHGRFGKPLVWMPGFWGWNGFTWVWIPGHWR